MCETGGLFSCHASLCHGEILDNDKLKWTFAVGFFCPRYAILLLSCCYLYNALENITKSRFTFFLKCFYKTSPAMLQVRMFSTKCRWHLPESPIHKGAAALRINTNALVREETERQLEDSERLTEHWRRMPRFWAVVVALSRSVCSPREQNHHPIYRATSAFFRLQGGLLVFTLIADNLKSISDWGV